jgi:hypothetical protein
MSLKETACISMRTVHTRMTAIPYLKLDLYFGDTQLKSWLVLPAILTGFMVFFSLSK